MEAIYDVDLSTSGGPFHGMDTCPYPAFYIEAVVAYPCSYLSIGGYYLIRIAMVQFRGDNGEVATEL